MGKWGGSAKKHQYRLFFKNYCLNFPFWAKRNPPASCLASHRRAAVARWLSGLGAALSLGVAVPGSVPGSAPWGPRRAQERLYRGG